MYAITDVCHQRIHRLRSEKLKLFTKQLEPASRLVVHLAHVRWTHRFVFIRWLGGGVRLFTLPSRPNRKTACVLHCLVLAHPRVHCSYLRQRTDSHLHSEFLHGFTSGRKNDRRLRVYDGDVPREKPSHGRFTGHGRLPYCPAAFHLHAILLHEGYSRPAVSWLFSEHSHVLRLPCYSRVTALVSQSEVI